MTKSSRSAPVRAALVAARGCAVLVGGVLAWAVVVAAYFGIAALASPHVAYLMVSPATVALAMLGFVPAPVVAAVFCSRWIVDGSWHRVFHPWDPPE